MCVCTYLFRLPLDKKFSSICILLLILSSKPILSIPNDSIAIQSELYSSLTIMLTKYYTRATTHTVQYVYTHTHVYITYYMCACMRVFVCMCMCVTCNSPERYVRIL